MSRRTRSGSSSHQEDTKSQPLVLEGLQDEHIHADGVENEVTLGENADSTDAEEDADDPTYTGEGLPGMNHGDQYSRDSGASDLAVATKSTMKSMSSIQVISRLLATTPDDPEVLTSVPQGQMKNSCLIVTVPPDHHWKTVLSDGLGSWRASKGPSNLFIRKDVDEVAGDVQATTISQEEYTENSEYDNFYFFQRRAYVNSSCPQYHRSVVTSADQRCSFAYLQYYFRDAIAHDFVIKTSATRDNHKQGRTFVTTSNGRKRRPLDGSGNSVPESPLRHPFARTMGASKSAPVVRLTADSVMKVDVLGVVPSETSVFRSSVLPDLLEDVVAKCMKEFKSPDAFVQMVKVAPSVEILLSSHRQLNDIRRFCTNSSNYSILCKESIPNISETGYTASFVVYEHLLLRGKDGKHPLVLGPIFIHQTAMDWPTAISFAATLIKLEPKLVGLLAVAPSGDAEVDQAFLQVFQGVKRHVPEATLLGMVHKRMAELGVTGESAELIKTGVAETIQTEQPLVELDQRVFLLMDTWQSLHENGVELGQYFLDNIVPILRQNLELKAKCSGGAVEVFSRQQCMKIKEVIKKACAKKSTVPELIGKLHGVVWTQQKELEHALLGRSDIKLDGEYANLAYDHGKFYDNAQTPMAQRRVILNRIHEEELH